MDDNASFKIELGPSVRRHIEGKKNPLEDSGSVAMPYDSPGEDQIPVFVAESAMRGIEAQVRREKEREVGGVLLGGFYRTEKGSFVEITDFIEAKGAKGTDVSLTFTHETWEQINADQAKRADSAQIVGWYHSHPGLGVFMSKEDEFIHSSFFTDPWHVAVVVDPIYANWGCFKWKDGVLERTGGFYVFAEKKAAKRTKEYVKSISSARGNAPRSASATADRRGASESRGNSLLWGAIVLLLILQSITGYLLLTHRGAPSQSPGYYARAVELLSASDLSDGARYLRLDLVDSPRNERTYRELERLNDLLSSPAASGVDDERMDEVNLMLSSADKLATGEMTCRESSELEGLELPASGDNSGFKAQIESNDPARTALRVYEWAARTSGARLARAQAVKRLMESKRGASASGARKPRAAWYGAAVKWLQGEETRRIAYGLQAGEPSYEKAYEKLSNADRKAVQRIRARLVKAK